MLCADGQLEAGYEKIALYANRLPWGAIEPTHAARQLSSGKWTSKLGALEDIEHDDPAYVSGPIYGGVVHYMKRPLPQKTIQRPDRVCTFDSDGNPLEVYSLPIGSDPIDYARRLQERRPQTSRPISAFQIETQDGKRTVAASDIVS